MPGFSVEFYPFAGLNNTIRLRDGRALVRLSDLLEGAPQPVLEAIAHILLAKLCRRRIHPHHVRTYRTYVSRREITAGMHRIRRTRGRKRILGVKGHIYDLLQIFEELNSRFFHGLLAAPRITWSRNASRNSLGHYDPAHNVIVISRIFDSARVPRYAVNYIVFHEMLHLKYPVRVRRGRRMVHPASFRAEEKRFSQLQQAKAWLKQLSGNPAVAEPD